MTQSNKGYYNDSARNTIAFSIMALLIAALSVTFASAASPVDLGSARDYIILAKSGISTTGTTSITGDIGVSPIDSTAITGFGLVMDSSNQFSTSSLIDGRAYASDYSPPTPTVMTTAILDMEAAYTDAENRALPDYVELGAGDIGGLTLTPGLYKWGTGVTIPDDVVLDGNSTDVWIFQIAGTLDISSGKEVVLVGGAQADNIFWQVAGQTTLGTNSIFNGIILDKTAIVMQTGATLNGRALAQTAVTLDANDVNLLVAPAPSDPNATTLTVRKLVVNDDDGTAVIADFTLYIDGDQVASGVANNVTPGTYTVSELQMPGYDSTIGGDCSPSGIVTLIDRQNKICLITNDDVPTVINDTQPPTDACYSWLKDIPAVCIGGTITLNTDLVTYDNCRHITCEDGTDVLEIVACEKPDEINPTYFEMYKRYVNGSGITICLGSACIEDNGFAAQDFPVCTSPDVPVDDGICHSDVSDVPVTCAGGTVIMDDNGSPCRSITCVNGDDSMRVLACEKPNEGTKTYFEVYKMDQTGTSVSEICLGNACISDNGFASQDFPVCSADTDGTAASLGVAQWFPQGGNYVFICDATGFSPTSYDWYFGDGHKLLDYGQDNTYHSYASGSYDVTCVAKNQYVSETAQITIIV